MSGHDPMPNAMRVALLKTQNDLHSTRAKLAAEKQAHEAERLQAKLDTAQIVHALKSKLAAAEMRAESQPTSGGVAAGPGDDAEQPGGDASAGAAAKAQDRTTFDVQAELAATKASLQAEYTRRGEAVMALLALAREHGYPIGVRVDPEDDPRGEWPVVTARLPSGEVSWHMPRAAVPHIDTMGAASKWDGSTVEDVSSRLNAYAASILSKE